MINNQLKSEYVMIINTLWGGSLQCNSIENISDDVIRLMDEVLTKIRDGSTAMIGVHAVFEIFYSKIYSSWAELIKVALDTADAHASDWIGVLRGNRQYSAVVNSAALGYKSPVQIALYEAAGFM
ncbi:hypothetical protein BGI36_08370 [Snodgrassella communis]|jgi:hypothetical protein|uniref:hypothetical protein n=1 Tax=Snodgrassella communis TaxID=2946699 RepID=UPI000C1F53B5|nr:hypothetical protein [Snodgrassella communis]PIT20193.1 hypothetical protein BGI36_08370 [Snodgrassella communis]PIT20389.1 hypothetical protein BGI35_08590 [Snodgrassella communis]